MLSIVQAGLKGAPVGVFVLVTVEDLDMDGAPSLLMQLAHLSRDDGIARRSMSGATRDQPESCKAEHNTYIIVWMQEPSRFWIPVKKINNIPIGYKE